MRNIIARSRRNHEDFKTMHKTYVTRLIKDVQTEAVSELIGKAVDYRNLTKISIGNITTTIQRLSNENITKLDQSSLSVDNSCNKSLVVQNISKVDELPAHGIPKPSHNSTIKDSESFKDECTSPCNEPVQRWAMFRNKNSNKPTTEVRVV